MPAPRLAYCTNVHAGTDLATTIANLERHATRVQALACPDAALGIGLWLSASAAAELRLRDDVLRLRDRLAALALEVVTLNGFPYGDFHGARVKRAVYEPHWGEPERAAYTLRLAEILVDLVPPGTTTASISTLPIGWRAACDEERVAAAATRLVALVPQLAALERASGVRVTVDLEPEPGCLLDRSADVVALFERFDRDADRTRRHLGVCHDICHAAVMFEAQRAALATYASHGIAVNKVQVSSALEAHDSDAARAELARYDEPRYLHQTAVRDALGAVRLFDDLPDALRAAPRGTWRTHFHVPIHLATIGGLRTTQDDIRACLAALGADPPTLEVETYAWTVLPEEHRPRELAEGIAAEMRWLAEALP